MDFDIIITLIKNALWYTLILSAPLLGVSLIVGLIISIFQTATSIQEQTLTFVPKIIAVFITFMFIAAWMFNLMVNYTTQLFALMNQSVR